MGKDEQPPRAPSKNIKNIYVHKINSLMRLSMDNLSGEDLEVVPSFRNTDKKIKKIYSETDKTTLKLEKNRESARKARQRKNLYIRLLENQIVFLKKQLASVEAVENSSRQYLDTIKNSSQPNKKASQAPTVEDELDRYISQENLAEWSENRLSQEKKVKRIEEITSEYRQWFIPDLLLNITNLKKPERNELNGKMMKAAYEEHHKSQSTLVGDESSLRLLLPFEEQDSTTKIKGLLRTLYKSTEEIQQLLAGLPQICQQVQELILSQEITDLEVNQMARNRIRALIVEQRICQVGDRPEKVIQRMARWAEFPSVPVQDTISKIRSFDTFVEGIQLGLDAAVQINSKEEEYSIISEYGQK